MANFITWLKDRKKENTIVPKTMTKAVYDDNGVALDRVLKQPNPVVDSVIFVTATSTYTPISYDSAYTWYLMGTYTITSSDGARGIMVKAYQYKAIN